MPRARVDGTSHRVELGAEDADPGAARRVLGVVALALLGIAACAGKRADAFDDVRGNLGVAFGCEEFCLGGSKCALPTFEACSPSCEISLREAPPVCAPSYGAYLRCLTDEEELSCELAQDACRSEWDDFQSCSGG